MAEEQNVAGKLPDVVPTTDTPTAPTQSGNQQIQVTVSKR